MKDKSKRNWPHKEFIQVADNYPQEIQKANLLKGLTWEEAALVSSIDQMTKRHNKR